MPRAGNITVPGSSLQSYKFYMDSDDGAQLYIDGRLLINHTGWSLFSPLSVDLLTLSVHVRSPKHLASGKHIGSSTYR